MEREVAAYEGGPEHRRLRALVGSWTGTARTWFDPNATPIEAPWSGRIEALLGGRFVRFGYQSTLDGDAIAGELVLGFHRDERQWTAAWIDSFHMGTDVMRSTGAFTGDAPIAVHGTYFAAADHPRWGWRTELDDGTPGELTLRMYNVTPQGEAALGVEARLRRVESP